MPNWDKYEKRVKNSRVQPSYGHDLASRGTRVCTVGSKEPIFIKKRSIADINKDIENHNVNKNNSTIQTVPNLDLVNI